MSIEKTSGTQKTSRTLTCADTSDGVISCVQSLIIVLPLSFSRAVMMALFAVFC